LLSGAGVEVTTQAHSVSRIADGDSEGSNLSCLSDDNACDAHSSGSSADVADRDSNRAAESVGCESGDPECEYSPVSLPDKAAANVRPLEGSDASSRHNVRSFTPGCDDEASTEGNPRSAVDPEGLSGQM
jgi:hypothetical protein